MRKIKSITAIILAITVIFQLSITAYAKSTSVSPYTGKTYTHQTKFDGYQKINCIDVSHHNGDIDFKKVKADGVKAVFIRIGYTGYTARKHSLNYDKNYKKYINDAIDAGLYVGAYWYSQALTTAEAKAEANKMISVIEDFDIKMPVVMDYEFASVSDGRLDAAWRNKTVNKTKLTANANAFLSVVEDAGYIPCVYASEYFFYDNLNEADLNENAEIWLAHYTTNTDYKNDFKYWQYTANGKVKGISSTYTDCNFIYLRQGESLERSFDVDDISNKEYTGNAIKPMPSVTFKGEMLVSGVDYMYTYKNNTNVGKASVTVVGINDYEALPSKTVSFKIVPSKVTDGIVKATTTNTATLSWEPAEKATRYTVEVYRKNGWVESGTTTETTYKVPDLNSASNYKFRIAGYRTIDGERYRGRYSNTIYGTTIPKKQSVTAKSTDKTVTLSWKNEKYCTGYKVYMYDREEGKYKLIKTIEAPDTTSYKVSKLKPNSRNVFKVRSYKISKEGKTVLGALSEKCVAYTKPSAPKLKTVTCTGSHRIKATWSKVDGVSGYQYRWSTTSNLNSDYLSKTISSKNSSVTIKTTKNKRYYYVKVRAYKVRDGVKHYSAWSNTIKVYVK